MFYTCEGRNQFNSEKWATGVDLLGSVPSASVGRTCLTRNVLGCSLLHHHHQRYRYGVRRRAGVESDIVTRHHHVLSAIIALLLN